jgi:hypothetical protein
LELLRYYLQTGFDYKSYAYAKRTLVRSGSASCRRTGNTVGGVPVTSGASGTVVFTDPTVLNGGSIESDTARILGPHYYPALANRIPR